MTQGKNCSAKNRWQPLDGRKNIFACLEVTSNLTNPPGRAPKAAWPGLSRLTHPIPTLGTHFLSTELLLGEVNAEQGPHVAQQLPPGPVPDCLEHHQVLLDAADGEALDLWGHSSNDPHPAMTGTAGKDRGGTPGWRGKGGTGAQGWQHGISWLMVKLVPFKGARKSCHLGALGHTPAALTWVGSGIPNPRDGYLQPLELLAAEEALAGSLEQSHLLGYELVPLLLQPGDDPQLQEHLAARNRLHTPGRGLKPLPPPARPSQGAIPQNFSLGMLPFPPL